MSALTGRPSSNGRPTPETRARDRRPRIRNPSPNKRGRGRGFSRFRAVEKATLEETGTDRRRDKTVLRLLLRKTGSPVRIGDLAVVGCVSLSVSEKEVGQEVLK